MKFIVKTQNLLQIIQNELVNYKKQGGMIKMVRIEFPVRSLNDAGLSFSILECLYSFKTKIKKIVDNPEYSNSENIKEMLEELEENNNCYKFVSGGLLFKISII